MYSILLAVGSAVGSSILTYFISFYQFKKQRAFLDKEERYKELIIRLRAFYGKTATSENREQFFEEYYKSWLYASPTVLKKLAAIVTQSKNLYTNPSTTNNKNVNMLLTQVITAIRSDIGITSKGLANDFFQYIEENRKSR